MADVVIVRECKHGQVRILYGDIISVEGEVLCVRKYVRAFRREGMYICARGISVGFVRRADKT